MDDTDTYRDRPEWVEGIVAALDWIGIARQLRGPGVPVEVCAGTHRRHRRALPASEAYFPDCTREAVAAQVGEQPRGHDGFGRDRNLPHGQDGLRFRTPDEGHTVVVGLVRGTPTFDNANLEDFVIARADSSAVFLLANVVDDITIKISHVIRAEEHLPNTPKQHLGERPTPMGLIGRLQMVSWRAQVGDPYLSDSWWRSEYPHAISSDHWPAQTRRRLR
jgi:glutamyl-tRNA synthetase